MRCRCTSFLIVLVHVLLLTGCGGTLRVELVETHDMTAEPTVDTDATVLAAIAATLTAVPTANTEATVAAAVAATLYAQPTINPDAIVATSVAATLTAVRPTSPSATTTATWTATSEPTETPTRSPAPSPTPCGLEPHPSLTAAWDRSTLGCAQDLAALVWAAWEPFEGGYLLWRSDSYDVYVLYRQDATTPSSGPWEMWYLSWDGSDPDGIGLAPPPGLVEPIRGFGWLWRTHLVGPEGRLGWALEPEKGICVRLQTFASGFIVGSSLVPTCSGQESGNATDPSLAPFVCVLYGDRTWECQ